MFDVQRFAATGSAYDIPPANADASLTLVGRGTPMGELLRRYWHPVYKSDKLTDLPVKVRALGDDIILFRKPDGEVGALYPRCVHRGADLLYGRPTEMGLRCPYHAWTFEPDGRCTAQPCEPGGGKGRGAVRQPWYPVAERYGLIFVYQGPIDKKPALPRYDILEDLPEGWDLYADDTSIPSGGAGHIPCNWLQHHENGIDPHHVGVVHAHQFPPIMAQAESTYSFEKADDRVIGRGVSKIGPMMMDFQVDIIIPNIRVIPDPLLTNQRPDNKGDSVSWTLPKDDTDTIVFTVLAKPVGSPPAVPAELYNGKAWRDLTFEEHQRFPGDFETQVGQGPITLHSEEHLVSGDKGIVFLRRQLQQAAKDVAEGRDPPLTGRDHDIWIKTTAHAIMQSNPDYVPPAEPDLAADPSAAAAPGPHRWALTLKTPMGEQKVTLAITSADGPLAGVMIGDDGESPIKDGRADGTRLTWKADVKKPIPLTLAFDVVIDGDAMNGTFKPGMFPAAPVSGVRV